MHHPKIASLPSVICHYRFFATHQGCRTDMKCRREFWRVGEKEMPEVDQPGFIEEYGLLLGLFLATLDAWRSYASPFQHPLFAAKSDAGRPGGRRDPWYLGSLLASATLFLVTSELRSKAFALLAVTFSLYRCIDLLVSLGRIAVVGGFGDTPTYRLDRKKVMRNTLAVLINYVELVFWYATIYLVLARSRPDEFYSATTSTTPSLAFILSFTTITTIGYGNIAPQKIISGFLCGIEALTALVMVSAVIGSLVSLAASSISAPTTVEEHTVRSSAAKLIAKSEPSRLTHSSFIWSIQRVLVFLCLVVASGLLIEPWREGDSLIHWLRALWY